VLNALMEYIYRPAIDNLTKDDWDKCEEESKLEFLAHTKKFGNEVEEAIKLMTPGTDLFKLDPERMNMISSSGN